MRSALCLVFFVSGAAALLFETLWFRQAGLALGNSVWTSSLVTASFMAGLALGSGLAARHADRVSSPLRAYALIEVLVGASGLLLVVLFPWLPVALAPLLGRLSDEPFALNGARLTLSFLLLLLPATAMGTSLPLVARALGRRNVAFSANLGLLYGFNTLGAMCGALLGEGLLLAALGVRLTGVFAATLSGVAALAAYALARREAGPEMPAVSPQLTSAPSPRELRLLASAFLAGGALLALEVVWFRLVQQFSGATSLTFAIMLAVVLLGIALGGLLGASVLRRAPDAKSHLPLLALLGGFATLASYANLPRVLEAIGGGFLLEPTRILAACCALMLPTSCVSGLLFTTAGAALRAGRSGEGETVGLLTLANTSGALLGALVSGFVLLPSLGSEASLYLIALAYGLMAVLTVSLGGGSGLAGQALGGAALVAYVGFVTFFPFGLMRNHFLQRSLEPWLRGGGQLVALREGLTETLSYTRRRLLGETLDYRLVVNGFSMSGSFYSASRYMRLFVYLPVAVHPGPRRALLISYGVGVTAQALTDTGSLQSIDVVDVSRDVLELARQVHPVPGPMPLDDPRVRVHVEDGRFFLLTTRNRYDLITGEPPPPRQNGIVNLYSREYFGLVRGRLDPGGIATYWLPVNQLTLPESRSILRAFCDVFEDCSLWAGSGYDWVLMGTNGANGPVSQESFERQWNDPVLAAGLDELGFETPGLLGTTFLADSIELRALVDDAPPLDDDNPHRLGSTFPQVIDPFYREFMDAGRRHRAFEQSALVRRLWPAQIRARSLDSFEEQGLLDLVLLGVANKQAVAVADVREMLRSTRLRTPVLWSLQSSRRNEVIASRAAKAGRRDPVVDELMAISALADRRPSEALRLVARARSAWPQARRLITLEDLGRSLTTPRD